MREDLESKLSASLANIEMELRKCTLKKMENGDVKAYLNVLAPNEEIDQRKKQKPFWLRLRPGHHTPTAGHSAHHTHSRDAGCNWGVSEVGE